MVKCRKGRKRALGTRQPLPRPDRINQVTESLNGKVRDECLNEHLFSTVAEAREILEDWQHDYNMVRVA